MDTAAPPPHRRCFIALMLPTSAWPALEAARALWRWPAAVRPLSGPDLHMTLHFIGDLAVAQPDALSAALSGVTMRPLQVAIDAPALWNNETAVLTGVASPEMGALHDAVGRALAGTGLPVDARRWRPHVSLARSARGAIVPAVPTPVSWQATGLALACASGGGAQRYRLLRTWPAARA
ncbi:MAG TPA: 2'-5' RNA ligase family protein [Aquabacterium sp.]|nr:2'-5' RNA ligase family protein [Aquabacterium sp.]